MSIGKKGLILAVAALFLSLSLAPAVTAEEEINTQKTYAVELTSIAENGVLFKESFQLADQEIQILQFRLSLLLNLLKNQVNINTILNLLLKFLDMDGNPVLTRIITRMFESEFLLKGKFVLSYGWGLDINPLKDSETSFTKPLTFWMYQEKSDMLDIPSMTAIVDLNPFELKTVTGSQLGLMFRFQGIYLHISQPLPQQSFTFILGRSRRAASLELPSISLPSLPSLPPIFTN